MSSIVPKHSTRTILFWMIGLLRTPGVCRAQVVFNELLLSLLFCSLVAPQFATAQSHSFAYVANFGSSSTSNPPPYSGSVSVIDTSTNTVVATLSVGSATFESGPLVLAVTPDGKHVYVSN